MIANRTELYLRDTHRIESRINLVKGTSMSAASSSAPKEHNQTVPPEAIVTVHLSNMRRAQEEAASMTGSMRSTFSRAEAKGLNLPAAKRALKIQKGGKADEFVAEMTELLRYLKILGVGIQKSQLDLFDTATNLAPIDEKAFEDGLLAGRFGEPEDDNPHDQSTPAGQKWIEGHRRGVQERKLVFEMEAAEESETGLVPADDLDQADIEDEDEPFGGEWPDDRQVAAREAGTE